MKDMSIAGASVDISTTPEKESTSWFQSFQRAKRRRENYRDHGYYPNPQPMTGPKQYNIVAANSKTVTAPLARELKGRHLQMIAFGGSIGGFLETLVRRKKSLQSTGTGLFVASGAALFRSGPAGLFLAYVAIGVLQFFTMQSLCELSVLFPVAGSFTAFSTRFIDPSWGFALGWIYFSQWLFVLPLEIIAAVFTITYWNDAVPTAVFVTIFLLLLIGINLSGIKIYGEAEYIFSIIKVISVIGFILLGIVINIGGPPNSGYVGWKHWSRPGPFNNGFKGFSSALITAVFSYGGTEMVGLAAAETRDPFKSLPKAIKHVFWRIAIFYLTTIMLVGLLVPSDDLSLISGKNPADASASAFVIAIESVGASILPSVMNSVILIAVLSVASASVIFVFVPLGRMRLNL
ncbi:hypothetical protein H9Q73_010951 [Fusarium xylarioides]|nr:hypothetical protein H9Q73_010951 [Fusarium xylarioides]